MTREQKRRRRQRERLVSLCAGIWLCVFLCVCSGKYMAAMDETLAAAEHIPTAYEMERQEEAHEG